VKPTEEPPRPAFAPDRILERLLQAVLCPTPGARDAFEDWRASIPFDAIPHSHFHMMGELADVVDRVCPGYEHRTRLLGMKKYVWSNNIHILAATKPLVSAFAAAKLRFVVLKGGGEIAADPSAQNRRFIRDLDLLVAEEDIPRAADLLFRHGWRAVSGRIPGRIRAQAFDRKLHGTPDGKSRVEIDLHRSVLHFGRNARFDDAFFGRTTPGNLLGTPVETLHAVDRALVSASHALITDPDKNFVWILDAVRAFRHPTFDWDHFFKSVEDRRMGRHLGPVLSYLDRTFQIGLPAGFVERLMRDPLALLFDAEIAAIGKNREGRGFSGRVVIFLAELLRSRAFVRNVPFQTDFGVRMCRSDGSVALDRGQPPSLRYAFRTDRDCAKSLIVDVACDMSSRRRRDLDLWFGDRWVAKLRIRAFPWLRTNASRVWRAKIEFDAPLDLQQLRLTDSAAEHARGR